MTEETNAYLEKPPSILIKTWYYLAGQADTELSRKGINALLMEFHSYQAISAYAKRHNIEFL